MNKYFLYNDNNQLISSYDFLAILRKIRSGAISPESLIARDDEPDVIRKAGIYPELAEIFAENGEPIEEQQENFQSSLIKELKNGWNMIVENPLILAVSAIFITFILMILMVVSSFPFPLISYTLAGGVVFLLLSINLLVVQRINRGQAVHFEVIKLKLRGNILPIFICGIIYFAPTAVAMFFMQYGEFLTGIIALIVFCTAGLYFLTLFIYAPLLVIMHKLDAIEALRMSRITLHNNIDVLSVLFAIIVINFLALPLFIIPSVVTLPILINFIINSADKILVER